MCFCNFLHGAGTQRHTNADAETDTDTDTNADTDTDTLHAFMSLGFSLHLTWSHVVYIYTLIHQYTNEHIYIENTFFCV